MTGIFRLKFV